MRLTAPALLLSSLIAGATLAQDGTRMLRFPDLHADQVVFGYAGDLWLAPVDGGAQARRLTSHPGLELYPRFSPDGSKIAFTGQYRGDEQVYVIDVAGGEPVQLTYYPTPGPLPARWGTDHQVYGWTPDGAKVLFRSMREDFNDPRLYEVAISGGLPSVLPMPRAGSGVFSPDGTQVLYSPLFRDFRTWKRYQGGWAQDLYVYDLKNDKAAPLATDRRTERDPVWLPTGIFYVSDRDGVLNLYAAGDNGSADQLTSHDTWDVKWASGDGVSRIVYEVQGVIGLYDTTARQEQLLSIEVPDDRVRRTARRIDVQKQIEDYSVSPAAERIAITARGDVFSVPAKHGITRNLTRNANAHDREVAWSPDGAHIAFISDRSGEEQVYVIDSGGGGEARALTTLEPLRLYGPQWAPDSKSLAFHDHEGHVHLIDLQGKHKIVASSPYGIIDDYRWAPDSRWITYSRQTDLGMDAVYVWSREDGETRQVSEPLFYAFGPAFSQDGKHLFFLSDRQFAPQIGAFEWNYVGDRETGIFALALTGESGNPFGPRNDEVAAADSDGDQDEAEKEGDGEKEDEDAEASEGVRVAIEFDGLSQRVIRVPVESDNIAALMPLADQLLYVTTGAFYYGRSPDVKTTLRALDFKTRKSKDIVADISAVVRSADGKVVVVRTPAGLKRIALAKPGEAEAISTANLIVYRAPTDEWLVAFDEVWRRFRDYFYVRNMHGYDWDALRERYRPLVQHVSTREDLNTLIGEMIAELNVGHAYVAGGDLQAPKRSSAALLGARFEADEKSARYRIGHIYAGHNAEAKYRSPLTEVGVGVEAGDYVIAIDGRELTLTDNPYDLLTDRGTQPVELTVSSTPTGQETRRVLVDPVADETSLVYLEWVEKNRRYVAEKTNGEVGYLHIPDMGAAGIYEFVKWFYPQMRRRGLIVDVRGNGGGNVSQMILRRLMQRPLAYGHQAHSEWTNTYPSTAFTGPMVALVSENSASDGDIFPYFFREAKLGPLIGKRSWGGVVGITSHGPLIDGGNVFVPEFGMSQKDKGWIIEGEGVSPDIEVSNDPTSDGDAQLERGIAEVMKRLEAEQPSVPGRPPARVKLRDNG
ncbi:MAG: S41 family peptidase [Pseudomonadota bacterium]